MMQKIVKFLMVTLICLVFNFGMMAQEVVINEVMYDSISSTDEEWVELFNTTANPIDLSNWRLSDDDTYDPSGEGYLLIPAGTSIPGDGYIVLCRVDLTGITGEIICTQQGSWTLGNSGDNLALYNASGTLVDGSTSVQYPDESPSNAGYSIEKIEENSGWSGDANAWDPSTETHPGATEHIQHTAGYQNSVASGTTPTPTATGPTATPTNTQPPSPTPTGPTPTPPPVQSIKINEMYINPPGTDAGCFVELYFPGGASLDGYSLVGVNGNGGVDYQIIDLSGHAIPADGFFVIGQDASVQNADLISTSVDYQNGPDSVQLRSGSTVIDAIGYGDFSSGAVFAGEGSPAPAYFTGEHSHSRYPDGNDTDDNSVDFISGNLTPGNPNEPEQVVTSTPSEPTFTPTPSGPTSTPTISPTPPPLYNLKINEVHVNPDGADAGSFVEIYNAEAVAVTLTGYRLVGINGFDGADYGAIDLTGTIDPSGFFVVAQDSSVPNYDVIDPLADYQNGPDNIQLRAGHIVVDAIGYGDFSGGETFAGEGMPVPYTNPTNNKSLSRYPDGTDTDDNSVDFINGELTSGIPNIPEGEPTPTPGPDTPTPPVPTFTPVPPTHTPPPSTPTTPPGTPTATPTISECTDLGVTIYMPSEDYHSGDPCSCTVIMCNPSATVIPDTPLFMILEVGSVMFFAPEFDDFSYYTVDIEPGISEQVIFSEFIWPEDAGNYDGAHWYAGITDPQTTKLLGEYDMFTFGWHSN